MNLYSKFANKFSEKRQKPWKGWEKVMPFLKEKEPLSILDLGCGNGRLLKSINNEELIINRYVGIDKSKILLNIARKEFGDSKFIEADLEGENWNLELKTSFNAICSFGLMHHIKNEELRIKILEKCIDLLEDGGYLIMSFWQFAKFPEFLDKHLIRQVNVGDEYNSSLSGNDDYILSFGGKESGAERFCHSFNNEELVNIDNEFKNLKRVEKFSADGLENRMNKYIVWQK